MAVYEPVCKNGIVWIPMLHAENTIDRKSSEKESEKTQTKIHFLHF